MKNLLVSVFFVFISLEDMFTGGAAGAHYRMPRQFQNFTFIPRSIAAVLKKELKFKMSARSLEDRDRFGKSDPYVILSIKDGRAGTETELGKTGIIQDSDDPNWGEVFHVHYTRGSHQALHFVVWDADAGPDEMLADTWVDLDEYVSKKEFMTIALPVGTLILEKAY